MVRLVQPEKALEPMLVTLSGMIMVVRLVQPENAYLPMLVTLSGIIILPRLVQPSNAPLPMLVTLPSVGMILFLQPTIKVLLAVSIKQLFVA